MTRNNETSIFEGKEKRSRNESEKQEQNGDKIIGEEGRERRKEGEKEKNRARFSLPGGKQPERGKQACCVDERRSVPVKSDLYRTRDAFQLGLEPQVFFFFFFRASSTIRFNDIAEFLPKSKGKSNDRDRCQLTVGIDWQLTRSTLMNSASSEWNRSTRLTASDFG